MSETPEKPARKRSTRKRTKKSARRRNSARRQRDMIGLEFAASPLATALAGAYLQGAEDSNGNKLKDFKTLVGWAVSESRKIGAQIVRLK